MYGINVNAIFMPTKELDAATAYLFAGREAILLAAVKSLSKAESCVAIYGERGVGKSSLGRILMGLLDGRIAPDVVGLNSNSTLTRRACVRIPWASGIQSLEHLLYQLFNPNREDALSFAGQFPKIADKCRKRFEQISLKELTAEGSAVRGKLKPNQVLVHEMVSNIEDAYFALEQKNDPAAKDGLVIVIDEMEQAKERGENAGLGRFIKNSRFQFITIGIGAAITDILDDDRSAERKFVGGQFLIEPLTTLETRELFAKASTQAAAQGAKLVFSDGFCDLVAEDFSGYPAQIQAFGLDVAMNYQKRLEAGIEVSVRESDYVPLLQLRETSTHRDIRAMNEVDAGVGNSFVRWEILKAVINIRSKETVRWITLDRIRRKVPSRYQVRLAQNLQELVRSNVLEADDRAATKVNIASPAILCEIKRRIRQGWVPRSPLNK